MGIAYLILHCAYKSGLKTALVNYTEIEVETIDIVVQDIIFDDFTPEPIQRNE